MEPRNLLAVYQGEQTLNEIRPDRALNVLKSHEISTLKSLCSALIKSGCTIKELDGFFVSFTIEQIGKEFDLLRFGSEIINIELKSEFDPDKVLKQMRANYYYLKFTQRPITIYTFVENVGFYEYSANKDNFIKVKDGVVAEKLKAHTVDYSIVPNKLFVPSMYLVSPFNSTEQFLNKEYFLTNGQQLIKDEILKELATCKNKFFCISANAGTGKTLLIYDIAREFISAKKRPALIHCGRLNEGQQLLIDEYGWVIWSIKDIHTYTVDPEFLKDYDIVIIDEAHRVTERQLKFIVDCAIKSDTPVIFSYDTKQYLKEGETRDIAAYLAKWYPSHSVATKRLTNKIRTNKNIASFITNLIHIGRSKDNLNYDDITIEYFDNKADLESYIALLVEQNWMAITYTVSSYHPDPYDELTSVSNKTAHNVIGQEFPKVVCVMDSHFFYTPDGELKAEDSYYSAPGMLYQIITRVVDKLKIIVYNNPALYEKLLETKSLGK